MKKMKNLNFELEDAITESGGTFILPARYFL